MLATKRLVLDLPEHTVAEIEARVAAGEFASADELVSMALQELDRPPEDDPGYEAWLRRGDEIVARLRSGQEPAAPLNEVFDRVEAGLQARAAAEGDLRRSA